MKRAYLKKFLAGGMSLALAAGMCPALTAVAFAEEPAPVTAEQPVAALEDGAYDITLDVQKTSDNTTYAMFKISNIAAVAKDGVLTADFDASKSYNELYLGTVEEAQAAQTGDPKLFAATAITENGETTGQHFTITLDASMFGQTVPVAIKNASKGEWYTNDAYTLQLAVGTPVKQAAPAVQLDNGTYSVAVTTGFGMFGLVSAGNTVIAKDGQYYLVVTSKTTDGNGAPKYVQLAKGKRTEAPETPADAPWIDGTFVHVDDETTTDASVMNAVQFVIPVTGEELSAGVSYYVRYADTYVNSKGETTSAGQYSGTKDYTFDVTGYEKTSDSMLLPGETEPADEPSVELKTQTIKLTPASKIYTVKALKKAKATLTVKVSSAKTALKVTPDAKAKKAKITAKANGKTKVKVTVPKKTKKGTYKITVTAKKSSTYKASKSKTITVKVK